MKSIIGFLIGFYITISIMMLMGGMIDSGYPTLKQCDNLPKKRYHYYLPAYMLGCKVGAYLNEEIRE